MTMLFVPPKGHGLANLFIMLTDFFHHHPDGVVHESIKDYEMGRWLTFHFPTTDRLDLPQYEAKIYINQATIQHVHPMIRRLVTPSPELEKELEKHALPSNIKLGIHLRRGAAAKDSREGVERDIDAYANEKAIQQMIQVAHSYGPDNVFLASDSPESKKLFPEGVHTLNNGVAVVHGSCLQGKQQDRLGIFLDFFLLSKCPTMIVTGSNFPGIPGVSTFGYMAAIYGSVPFMVVTNA